MAEIRKLSAIIFLPTHEGW